MFKDLWDHVAKTQKQRKANYRKDSNSLDDEIDKILDRITDVGSAKVIRAFEKKIEQLENEKIVIEKKIIKIDTPQQSFNQMHRTAQVSELCEVFGNFKLEKEMVPGGGSIRIAFGLFVPFGLRAMRLWLNARSH